ncbi:MAG TPA: hypothetical protein VEK33_05925 [Terriglobales bacterium]|nr:hypothetical protein [Terriglobales bacterium]
MPRPCPAIVVCLLSLAAFLSPPRLCSQKLAKRLILKDGSYQLASQWEVKGDRVRYLSAERDEWEEVPYSLVDWAATEKFEKEHAGRASSPEAEEVDQELASERAAEEAKTPQVAPGLRLPEDGSVMLLDTFQNHPQLVELEQSGGQLNRNRKENVLRAVVNPAAGSKQSIELEGAHAKVQAHVSLPSLYINLPAPEDSSVGSQPRSQPSDRFLIVRLMSKNGKRILGEIKISVLGKVSHEESLVPTTSEELTGGWVKITPTTALPSGEYAVAELLGNEGVNTFVWDFGVNPSAPANPGALEPAPAASDKP